MAESNCRPLLYEGSALPTELIRLTNNTINYTKKAHSYSNFYFKIPFVFKSCFIFTNLCVSSNLIYAN